MLRVAAMSKRALFLGPLQRTAKGLWLSSMKPSTFSVCSMPDSLYHKNKTINSLLMKSLKALVRLGCFKMLIKSCSWSTSQRLEGPSLEGSLSRLQVDRSTKDHCIIILEGSTELCVEYVVVYRGKFKSSLSAFQDGRCKQLFLILGSSL